MKLKAGDYIKLEGVIDETLEKVRDKFVEAGFDDGETLLHRADYELYGIDAFDHKLWFFGSSGCYGSKPRLLTVEQVLGSEDAMPKQNTHIMETFGPIDEAEKDPHGKSQHDLGAKLDQGKNRLSLVLGGFAKSIQEVGKVGTFGAGKYADNSWKSVPDAVDRYSDAMLRHYFAEESGETIDKGSELRHAAHLAWNALARLEMMLEEGL